MNGSFQRYSLIPTLTFKKYKIITFLKIVYSNPALILNKYNGLKDKSLKLLFLIIYLSKSIVLGCKMNKLAWKSTKKDINKKKNYLDFFLHARNIKLFPIKHFADSSLSSCPFLQLVFHILQCYPPNLLRISKR